MTRPVDAATAFAALYQRWFDDARCLAEENRRQACGAIGTYVADVLTIWDERARTYLSGAPTILRLETCDVAAFAMREPHIALFFGSVETDAPIATFGPSADAACETSGTTLRWKSFRPCSYAIGRQVDNLVMSTDENGLLVELEAVLDDGGRLVIGDARLAGSHAHGRQGGYGVGSLPRAV